MPPQSRSQCAITLRFHLPDLPGNNPINLMRLFRLHFMPAEESCHVYDR